MIRNTFFNYFMSFCLTFLFGGIFVYADVSGDYEYTNHGDGTATITAYTTNYTVNLVIPATLDGNDVISIGDSAFLSKNLEGSVTIPDSVLMIGVDAFRSNYGLTNLTLGNSVTSIAERAFYVTKLKALTIPDSVITIGDNAFYYNNIATLTLGTNVTSIGARAFMNNRVLTTLSIPDSTTIIASNAFYDNALHTLTLGTGIVYIGVEAFTANDLTNGVVLPNGITTLDNYAFYRAGLTSINIPTNLLSLGHGVFNNNAISMVNGTASDGIIYARTPEGLDDTSTIISYGGNAGGSISNSVTTIGAFAFARNSIYSMSLPDTVTTIEESAFWSCGLSAVNTGNGVTTIGTNAFLENSLTNVVLGSNIITIAEAAFKNNDIAAVSIPDQVLLIEKEAFLGNRITTLTIGNSVTNIGLSSFMYNYITSVIIPDSVTYIAGNAFYQQDNSGTYTLTNLVISTQARYIGAWAFRDSGITNITLPASPVWGDFMFAEWTIYGTAVVDLDPSTEGIQVTSQENHAPYIARYDAQPPVITTDLTNENTTVGTALTLDATATVTDGGILSYQWFNTDDSNSNPVVIGSETNTTYSVPVATPGTFYYYCQINNTNGGVNGSTTATVDSAISTVTVISGGGFSDWTVAEGIPEGQRGEFDDPAGDGFDNIWKYAHGLTALTEYSQADFFSCELSQTGTPRFLITYQSSKSASGVELYPVWTTLLNTGTAWQTTGITTNKVGETAEQETWEASIPADTSEGFMSLQLDTD